MDKEKIALRFSRAAESYEQEATVQRRIATSMLKMLEKYYPMSSGSRILEIGCGTGIYSRMLQEHFSPSELICNDLSARMGEQCMAAFRQAANGEYMQRFSAKHAEVFPETCRGNDERCSNAPENQFMDMPSPDALLKITGNRMTHTQIRFLEGDAEEIDFPSPLHLITSCSTVQWFRHPERFLQHCHRKMQAGGILAVSTFTPGNLHEIQSLTGQGLDYKSIEQWRSLLEKNRFAVLEMKEEKICQQHSTPLAVLRHLQKTGVTAVNGDFVWTPSRLQTFRKEYIRCFSTDTLEEQGKATPVSLTWKPLYFVAKREEK